MKSSRARVLSIVLVFTATAIGCTDSGPDSLNVAGSWLGGAAFGGTQAVTTRMALTQTGTAISGTLRATGALPFDGVPITGQIDVGNRTMTWIAADGCETWGGVLNVDAEGTGMTGPILIDRSGCSSGNNSSGTLTLARQ